VLARGTIVARFTGQPVPGACVAVFGSDQVEVARACADDVGRYQISTAGPANGDYKVKATAPGYADTWYSNLGDVRDFAKAQAKSLGGVHLDLGLRPPGEGVLRGQLTADLPGFRARVRVRDADYPPQQRPDSVGVAPDGTYRVEVPWPAHYKIEILTEALGNQWYHQKDLEREADAVAVPAGGDTVVDEQIFPRGIVDLTVVDEATGAPVNEFCVFTPGVGADRPCTTTGQIDYKLVRGTYNLLITTQKTHFGVDVHGVTVGAGAVTKVVAKAKPGIAIQTTVTDSVTGSPVAGTCVQPIEANRRSIGLWNLHDWCSDAAGKVTIGPLLPDVYRLFAVPGDQEHGMQWVGRLSGGTGDERLARQIDGNPGVYTRIPPIRLDGAGTITGVVQDKQSGEPIWNVSVSPYAGGGISGWRSEMNGTYRITGLGPYWWPLQYAGDDHAWQWSGSAVGRFDAVPVKVTVGRDTQAPKEALTVGGTLAGLATVKGDELGNAIVHVDVVNARTGDIAGPRELGFSDGYMVRNIATQQVKVFYWSNNPDLESQAWYKDATTFHSATPVQITAGATTGGIDQQLRK
jgi:hypothetical protein